jgi:hypothetical protein
MIMGSHGNRLVLLWTQMTGYQDADILGVTFAPDVQTGIAVDDLVAVAKRGSVRVTWHVTDGRQVATLRLLRRGGGLPDEDVPIPVDHDGLYQFDDGGVTPLGLYEYHVEARLRDGRTMTLGPVLVTIPGDGGAAASLEVTPNPSGSGAFVRFFTPGAAAIRISGHDPAFAAGGYAPLFAFDRGTTLSRAAIAALPLDQRELTLRVDASDPLAHAIADRIAVDAREIGFVLKVQAPAGLAPRPDARLVRVRVPNTSPDRALAALIERIANRDGGTTQTALPPAATLDAVYQRRVSCSSVPSSCRSCICRRSTA